MAISSIASDAARNGLAKLGDVLAGSAHDVEGLLGIGADKASTRVAASADKLSLSAAARTAPDFSGETALQKVGHVLGNFLSWLGDHTPTPLRKFAYDVIGLVQPVKDTPVISNLGKLDDHLFRGEQLGPQGFDTLKNMGVDTVINLEPESNTDVQYAQKVGMKVIEDPEPPIGEPTMAQGIKFLSAVTDPANGKVYFHCYHGSDRTGAMAAIYRVVVQGWSVDKAIAEMPTYHFHAGIEDSKVNFIYDFLNHWKTLSSQEQAQILHRAPASQIAGAASQLASAASRLTK